MGESRGRLVASRVAQSSHIVSAPGKARIGNRTGAWRQALTKAISTACVQSPARFSHTVGGGTIPGIFNGPASSARFSYRRKGGNGWGTCQHFQSAQSSHMLVTICALFPQVSQYRRLRICALSSHMPVSRRAFLPPVSRAPKAISSPSHDVWLRPAPDSQALRALLLHDRAILPYSRAIIPEVRALLPHKRGLLLPMGGSRATVGAMRGFAHPPPQGILPGKRAGPTGTMDWGAPR